MRILIAPDKFKGTLSAQDAAEAIARGIRQTQPDWELDLQPVADGGEGSMQLITEHFQGEVRQAASSDALGKPVMAEYGWIEGPEGPWAVIEMSSASGIWRIPESDRNPLLANTRGTGAVMKAATLAGATRLVLTLGGSATNDGGTGMASTLGIRFLDKFTDTIDDMPSGLSRLESIDMLSKITLPRVDVLCDVDNPLLGPRGCTSVFGPQKGVTDATSSILEAALQRLAEVTASTIGKDFSMCPGAGSAGGLGFGLMAFADAQFYSGFTWIASHLGLEERIRKSDLVITGEGCLDSQTTAGKAPHGVCTMAHHLGKKVVAMAGVVQHSTGFDEVHSLQELEPDQQKCLEQAAKILERLAARWAGKKSTHQAAGQ